MKRVDRCGSLGDIPGEILQAYRYLCARVAVDAGTLREVGWRDGPDGDELICVDRRSGKMHTVTRPATWTLEDELYHIGELRQLLRSAIAS